MPRAHRAHAEWTPSRLIAWAAQTGAATGRLVAGILERRPHPEQGYRACLGLMRLGRLHGADRLEAPVRAPSSCAPIGFAPSNTFSSISRTGCRSRIRPLHARRCRTRICAAPRTTRRLMLTHPTIEKLHTLRLMAMAAAFEQQRSSSQHAELSV